MHFVQLFVKFLKDFVRQKLDEKSIENLGMQSYSVLRTFGFPPKMVPLDLIRIAG